MARATSRNMPATILICSLEFFVQSKPEKIGSRQSLVEVARLHSERAKA